MPLFEVETDSHIIITWAENEDAAKVVVADAYPSDEVVRLTKRPRDTWVISKGALGLTDKTLDPCAVARECLSRSAGDKVNAKKLPDGSNATTRRSSSTTWPALCSPSSSVAVTCTSNTPLSTVIVSMFSVSASW